MRQPPITRPRVAAFLLACAIPVLAAASIAYSCTVPVGFTWYSDGTSTKQGPGGGGPVTTTTEPTTPTRASQAWVRIVVDASYLGKLWELVLFDNHRLDAPCWQGRAVNHDHDQPSGISVTEDFGMVYFDDFGDIPLDVAEGPGQWAFRNVNNSNECSPRVSTDISGQAAQCQMPPGGFPGGRHNQFTGALRKIDPRLDGCHRHHVPAQSAWRASTDPKYPPRCTAVVIMRPADHRDTGSWGRHVLHPDYGGDFPAGGGTVLSTDYQARQRDLILESGDAGFLQAFLIDKRNVLNSPVGNDYIVGFAAAEQAAADVGACRNRDPRSGPIITAYATAARPNRQFLLVTANNQGEPGHDGHACMFNATAVNPTMRTSSSTGFIANTSGVVSVGPGVWQICFREPIGSSATVPVSYTAT